jgi:hypothetical protein
MMLSTAPYFEDVLLHRCLGSLRGLAYAELDPGDPSADSVSQWFDLSGWRGIIAVAGEMAAWEAARPNAVVLGTEDVLGRAGAAAEDSFGFIRLARPRRDAGQIIGTLQPLVVVAASDPEISGYVLAHADAARVYLVRADHAALAPSFRLPLRRDEFRCADSHAAALGRMLATRETAIAALHAEGAAQRARDEGELALRQAEIATRDQRIGQLEQENAECHDESTARMEEIAALQAGLAAKEAEIAALRPPAEQLARLAEALDWPDGPRAVRAFLPMARLIRKAAQKVR